MRVSALLVINSLIICSLLIWAALGLSGLIERQLAQIEDLSPSVRVLVGKIFRIFVLLVAFLTGLNVVGIDLTALAVFSGALGLGIGFGLQKIVSNLLSGIILLMDKSIKPGDVIEIQTPTGSTYGWVEHLGAPINSPFHEVDPFIAPDQSYLIFCSDRPGGHGKDDMYVVFARDGGGWTAPVTLGEAVNSPDQEYIPSVSRDGRFFFFTSNTSGQRDIYWMDASIIERLRPKESETPSPR